MHITNQKNYVLIYLRQEIYKIYSWNMIYLKVGYVFFQKRFRKRVGAEYQNKLVANQQLKGVSYSWWGGVCCCHSVLCCAAPAKVLSTLDDCWKSFEMNASSRLLSGSSVDSIISDYNEFYSILSRRAAHVRCRHGVTIRQRSRTCVNIGLAFQHWRELKERKACDQTPRLLCFFSIVSNIGLLCFPFWGRGMFVLVISNINIGYQKSLTPPLIY